MFSKLVRACRVGGTVDIHRIAIGALLAARLALALSSSRRRFSRRAIQHFAIVCAGYARRAAYTTLLLARFLEWYAEFAAVVCAEDVLAIAFLDFGLEMI